MEKPDISDIFYEVELKIQAYESIILKGGDFSKEYTHQLTTKLKYSLIDANFFRYNYDQLSNTINSFLKRINEIINDKNKFLSLVNAYSDCMEFETFESCKKEKVDELTEIQTRLQYYLDCYSSKHITTKTPEIKRSIINGLIAFDGLDKNIFNEDVDEGELKENLNHFIVGDFEKINPVLNFNFKNKAIGYYFINAIVDLTGKNLVDVHNIQINGKPYKRSSASTAVSKLIKESSNNELSQERNSHLSEIHNFLRAHVDNYVGNY
jgi:hypothetical protein